MSQTLAGRLAERSASYRLDPGNVELLGAARTAIIDTLAATLCGVTQDCTRIATQSLGSLPTGTSTLAGSDRGAGVLEAAFINGVASHAMDFDDFTQDFGGHPSVPIVPGLLALAESEGASGAQLMQAYVAGVELETWFARGVHFHHYEKGWHPTCTLGVFGGAAAAANLMGLDARTTTTALAIAASLACGIKASFGTMTKPLQVGQCARGGVHAALLARAGLDANPAVLEHPQGFLEVYNGAGNYHPERMLEPWFAPSVILDPGISIKQFACCGSTHPAIYMALELRERGVRAEQIHSLEILTHPRRLPHTDNPHPGSGLEAKFSIQYCAARSLISGPPRLSDFEDGAFDDEAVRSLMARTQARPHPDMPEHAEKNFGAELVAQLEDGTRQRAFTAHLPGRGASYPMRESELRDKFEDCASRVMQPGRIEALWSSLRCLEDLDDLRGLLRATAPPPRLGAASARGQTASSPAGGPV